MMSLILHNLTQEQLQIITKEDMCSMKRILFRATPTGIAIEIAITVVSYVVSCALKKK